MARSRPSGDPTQAAIGSRAAAARATASRSCAAASPTRSENWTRFVVAGARPGPLRSAHAVQDEPHPGHAPRARRAAALPGGPLEQRPAADEARVAAAAAAGPGSTCSSSISRATSPTRRSPRALDELQAPRRCSSRCSGRYPAKAQPAAARAPSVGAAGGRRGDRQPETAAARRPRLRRPRGPRHRPVGLPARQPRRPRGGHDGPRRQRARRRRRLHASSPGPARSSRASRSGGRRTRVREHGAPRAARRASSSRAPARTPSRASAGRASSCSPTPAAPRPAGGHRGPAPPSRCGPVARVGGHAADRRAQHAELPAAARGRAGRPPGAAQARPLEHDRGVAGRGGVHPRAGQRPGDPLRARHPHVRERDPQHAGPLGRAGAARADAPAGASSTRATARGKPGAGGADGVGRARVRGPRAA